MDDKPADKVIQLFNDDFESVLTCSHCQNKTFKVVVLNEDIDAFCVICESHIMKLMEDKR